LKYLLILFFLIIAVLLLRYAERSLSYKILHFPPIKNTTPVSAWGIEFQPYRIMTQNQKSIEAILCGPDNTGPLIIGIHGYENTVEKLVPISGFLTARGYRCLLINTRNHGESDADSYSTIMQYIQDLQAAINFSRELSPANDKLILLGHSLGAVACLYVAPGEPRISAVISIASFADMKQQLQQTFRDNKFPTWLIPVMLRFLELAHHIRMRDFSAQYNIARISVPLLLLHGSEDQLVAPGDFEMLRSQAQGRLVTARLLTGQDHSSLLNQEEVFSALYDFLKKNNL
jgi:alpha-beta hydrolase superfamily lysophospholipase